MSIFDTIKKPAGIDRMMKNINTEKIKKTVKKEIKKVKRQIKKPDPDLLYFRDETHVKKFLDLIKKHSGIFLEMEISQRDRRYANSRNFTVENLMKFDLTQLVIFIYEFKDDEALEPEIDSFVKASEDIGALMMNNGDPKDADCYDDMWYYSENGKETYIDDIKELTYRL